MHVEQACGIQNYDFKKSGGENNVCKYPLEVVIDICLKVNDLSENAFSKLTKTEKDT